MTSPTPTLTKNLVALIIWRDIIITPQNISNIKNNEFYCSWESFVDFTILKKNINLNKYRIQYQNKTGKNWRIASIQEIFKAEMEWPLF